MPIKKGSKLIIMLDKVMMRLKIPMVMREPAKR